MEARGSKIFWVRNSSSFHCESCRTPWKKANYDYLLKDDEIYAYIPYLSQSRVAAKAVYCSNAAKPQLLYS